MTTPEDFRRAALEQMIAHDHALETFPFLSAQILNRWRRDGKVRFFKGKEGKIIYPREDLNDALNKELTCGETDDQRDFGNTKTSGSALKKEDLASTDIGMTEADALREKLFLQQISTPPKKNSSPSSAHRSRQAKIPERSSSSMS